MAPPHCHQVSDAEPEADTAGVACHIDKPTDNLVVAARSFGSTLILEVTD
ncbi:hypothetical protein [Streptomyces sp. NPDC059256]